jgi:hypothetical protein
MPTRRTRTCRPASWQMSAAAVEHFGLMFESLADEVDYFTRFPPYLYDRDAGAMTWWPPLCEVWDQQGSIPGNVRAHERKYWVAAWALLQRMYQEYEAARK